MNPRPGRLADRGLHDVDESCHVVIGDCLAITDRLHKRGIGDGRLGPACCGIGCRHDAEGGLRLGRQLRPPLDVA